MLNHDLWLQYLRKPTALPIGRTHRHVTLHKIEGMLRIPRPNPCTIIKAQRKLRIKPEVCTFCVVVPLAKVDESSVGVDLLRVQRLPPSGVRQNDIGDEPTLS
ncbi:hypothetical protein D3C71_974580 [compost metagenome]